MQLACVNSVPLNTVLGSRCGNTPGRASPRRPAIASKPARSHAGIEGRQILCVSSQPAVLIACHARRRQGAGSKLPNGSDRRDKQSRVGGAGSWRQSASHHGWLLPQMFDLWRLNPALTVPTQAGTCARTGGRAGWHDRSEASVRVWVPVAESTTRRSTSRGNGDPGKNPQVIA